MKIILLQMCQVQQRVTQASGISLSYWLLLDIAAYNKSCYYRFTHTHQHRHPSQMNVTEIFQKTFLPTDPQVLTPLFLQLVKPEIAFIANFASINQSNKTIKLINE